MSKLPTMPFVVSDYIADTTHLSLEEHGAYLLLLFAMWRHEGFLPDIDADNARLLGVAPKHWLKLKARLAPFLIAANGRLSQKRLQIQWNWAIEQRDRQKDKGRKGGLANAITQKLKRQMSNVKQSTASSPASTTASSTATSTRGSPEQAFKEERIIPTTSQEDRGAELEIPACLDRRRDIHRLLKTPAMRKTA
jgi:uncharacterized protein YdaU (DUF1376 family)